MEKYNLTDELAVLRKKQGYDKLNGILRTEKNRFHAYLYRVRMAVLAT